MLKSLRYRVLLWFVLSTLAISVLAFTLFQIYKSSQTKNQLVLDNFEYFRYQFLKDQNQISGFLSSDIYETSFYITGESSNLNEHYKLISDIDSCFINGFSKQSANFPHFNESIFSIRDTYTKYCMYFDSLVYNIYKRGFKDFGLEGQLASSMYELQKSDELPFSSLTQLKLSEKEYLHVYNQDYIEPIYTICENLKINVQSNSAISKQKKQKLITLLEDYVKAFDKIVELDKKLGFSTKDGLRQQVNIYGSKLEKQITASILETNKAFETQKSKINNLFGLSAFLLVSLAFFISVYTSKYLVKYLEQLTNYISSLTKTNFNQKIDIDLKHSTSEISQIYKEFRNMLTELRVREKQRDFALRYAEDNQQRYRDLADLLPQSIYETDRVGNLTYVNEAWYKTFGYSKLDIHNGVNLIEILNTDNNSNLFGNAKVENNDFLALRKDGTKFPATVYSDVIKKGLRVIGRRGIIIDTTLRQKYIESLKNETKRAITSDKHKSSFLANMSHEIRTPMNSIIGFSNMLSSKEIPAEEKEGFIDHIQSSSEMLLNLVDDIIDVAKIEAGQLKISKSNCNPNKLIISLSENFEAYKNRIEKENIEIKINLPENDLPFKTDEFRLRQILTNLMSNAIKFTEEGNVEIGMRLKGQRMLEFYVEDTGIGMTKEELRTIFDRFTRTKLSEEKKISGTGLGLAISKNLVELLGGNMWVTSEADIGTRFSFELPYDRVVDGLDDHDEELFTIKDYDWRNKTVLVAEDDDNGFTYLSHILNGTGIKIIRAMNGAEAVAAVSFHKKAIDIILMDLQMPELNGLQATRKIKEEFPEIAIIAQTAFAMDGDRIKCIEAGCDDYITKPLNEENLLAKMAQFIAITDVKSTRNEVTSQTQSENIKQHSSKNK